MLNKDFKEFAELLNANAVEYLIVGGYALMVHGVPRYTGDIDFWVSPHPHNITRLLQALDQFGFKSLGITPQDFAVPDAVIQLGYPPARIDLMTSIDGVEFGECYAQRLEISLDEIRLSVISHAMLVRNKEAVGRLKDLADVEELKRTTKASK